MKTEFQKVSEAIKSQLGNLLKLLKVDERTLGARPANLYDLLNSPLVGSQNAAKGVPPAIPGGPDQDWLHRADALAAVGRVPKFQNESPTLTSLIQELAMLAKDIQRKGLRLEYDRLVIPDKGRNGGSGEKNRGIEWDDDDTTRPLVDGGLIQSLRIVNAGKLLASLGFGVLISISTAAMLPHVARSNAFPTPLIVALLAGGGVCWCHLSLASAKFEERNLSRQVDGQALAGERWVIWLLAILPAMFWAYYTFEWTQYADTLDYGEPSSVIAPPLGSSAGPEVLLIAIVMMITHGVMISWSDQVLARARVGTGRRILIGLASFFLPGLISMLLIVFASSLLPIAAVGAIGFSLAFSTTIVILPLLISKWASPKGLVTVAATTRIRSYVLMLVGVVFLGMVMSPFVAFRSIERRLDHVYFTHLEPDERGSLAPIVLGEILYYIGTTPSFLEPQDADRALEHVLRRTEPTKRSVEWPTYADQTDFSPQFLDRLAEHGFGLPPASSP